jgi:hypothetical protein
MVTAGGALGSARRFEDYITFEGSMAVHSEAASCSPPEPCRRRLQLASMLLAMSDDSVRQVWLLKGMFVLRSLAFAIPLQTSILAQVSARQEQSCRLPDGHVCIPGGSCYLSPDSRACNSPLLCALGSRVERGKQLPYRTRVFLLNLSLVQKGRG